jgi:hypothetical protein
MELNNVFSYLALLSCLIIYAVAQQIQPQAIYDGGVASANDPITLRIGNGGAGQSGLVKGNCVD